MFLTYHGDLTKNAQGSDDHWAFNDLYQVAERVGFKPAAGCAYA
jgi:hypothetical protein